MIYSLLCNFFFRAASNFLIHLGLIEAPVAPETAHHCLNKYSIPNEQWIIIIQCRLYVYIHVYLCFVIMLPTETLVNPFKRNKCDQG